MKLFYSNQLKCLPISFATHINCHSEVKCVSRSILGCIPHFENEVKFIDVLFSLFITLFVAIYINICELI